MNIDLKANPEILVKKATSLQTARDVADILEIPYNFLNIILYGNKERERYHKFQIQKKSKLLRDIYAPPQNLSILQKKLNVILKLLYKPKECVNGFAKGKSIVSNADCHKKKLHIINIDIKNFFPTINIHRVKGCLKSFLKCGDKAALVLAQICCLNNGELPQGASTSPIISNIICRALDNELINLAKRNGCMYSRYADDITFSTNLFVFPKEIAQINDKNIILSNRLLKIFERNNFVINDNKTRYMHPLKRQEVTGSTVNEFPNINRNFTRSILGALHAWEKYNYEPANQYYQMNYMHNHRGKDLANVIWGKILFLKMVLGEDSPIFRKIAFRFNKLSNKIKINIKPISEIKPFPLKGKVPQGDVWAMWFERYSNSIAFIETVNKNRDKCTATGFYIGNNKFGTALHVLKNKIMNLYVGENPIEIKDTWPEYDDDKPDVGIINSHINNEICPIPSQMRLPKIGEEVAAIGYPVLPCRLPTIVMHTGIVEALPISFWKHRFIQVSFQSGGGLSGGVLIDKRGFAIGVMAENIFQTINLPIEYHSEQETIPNKKENLISLPEKDSFKSQNYKIDKTYGQAVPIEYLHYL